MLGSEVRVVRLEIRRRVHGRELGLQHFDGLGRERVELRVEGLSESHDLLVHGGVVRVDGQCGVQAPEGEEVFLYE